MMDEYQEIVMTTKSAGAVSALISVTDGLTSEIAMLGPGAEAVQSPYEAPKEAEQALQPERTVQHLEAGVLSLKLEGEVSSRVPEAQRTVLYLESEAACLNSNAGAACLNSNAEADCLNSNAGAACLNSNAEATTLDFNAGAIALAPETGATVLCPEAGITKLGHEAGVTLRDHEALATATDPEGEATALNSEAGVTALDPEAGATALDPEAGATALDPEAGATSLDPNAGASWLDPEAGACWLDPEAGAFALDLEAGAFTLDSEGGAFALDSEAGAFALDSQAGSCKLNPDSGACALPGVTAFYPVFGSAALDFESGAAAPVASTSSGIPYAGCIDEPMPSTSSAYNYNDAIPSTSGACGRGARRREPIDNWRDCSASNHGRRYRYCAIRRPNQGPGQKKIIPVPSLYVGRIIGRGGIKVRGLENETGAKIRVGESTSTNTNITLMGSFDDIDRAERRISNLIDQAAVSLQNEASNSNLSFEFFRIASDGTKIIDWEKLNAYYIQHQQDRYAQLAGIVKDFYREDPDVTVVTPEEADRWRKRTHNIQVCRPFEEGGASRPIRNPVMSFEQAFQYFPDILEELYRQGFRDPTPIQCQSWPILLCGQDLIVVAPSRSGKTLAYLLPALVHIEGQPIPRDRREGPLVLIVVPTQETALLVEEEVWKYQYARGIKSVCITGGGDRKDQVRRLTEGVDLVIATPGRLSDFMITRLLNAINFSYVVIDDADLLIEMGYESQIRKSLFDVRPDKITVITSTTWSLELTTFAQCFTNDPIQVNVGSLDISTLRSVTQMTMLVDEREKEKVLMQYLRNVSPTDKVLIFCSKKSTAMHLSVQIGLNGKCESSDENKDEEMEDILEDTTNIFVTTDAASRNIEIEDLTHVINLDFPRHIEEYINRVGKASRAGRTGTALTFITRENWAHAGDLIKILQESQQEIPDELEQMAQRYEAMRLKNSRGKGGRGRDRYTRGKRDHDKPE